MSDAQIQTPVITLDIQQKIDRWRQRAVTGELTLEEMREAVTVMRNGRLAAAEANAASTKKSGGGGRTAKTPVNVDKLLEDF